MFKLNTLSLSAAALIFAANITLAADMHSMDNMQMGAASDNMQTHKGQGVVNKINAKSGKVNITHEPIESMSWPKMTMDFSVINKADLESIKPGMAVDFELAKQGKSYRISHIAPAKK